MKKTACASVKSSTRGAATAQLFDTPSSRAASLHARFNGWPCSCIAARVIAPAATAKSFAPQTTAVASSLPAALRSSGLPSALPSFIEALQEVVDQQQPELPKQPEPPKQLTLSQPPVSAPTPVALSGKPKIQLDSKQLLSALAAPTALPGKPDVKTTAPVEQPLGHEPARETPLTPKSVAKQQPAEPQPTPPPSDNGQNVATLSAVAQQALTDPPIEQSPAVRVEPQPAKAIDPLKGPEPSPNTVTGDLAIAMKVTTSAKASEPTPSTVEPLRTPVSGPATIAAPAAIPAKHEPAAITALGQSALGTQGRPAVHEPAAETLRESKATPHTSFETEFEKAQIAEPVRSAHVQITGANNQQVDIRLLERGGSLSVSVRSADTGLTRALQDHVPELTHQLSSDHFKTDLWTSGAAKESSGERPGSNNQQRDRENDPRSGDNPGQKGNQQKKQQDPQWVTEFENTPQAFQKRINYSWHQ